MKNILLIILLLLLTLKIWAQQSNNKTQPIPEFRQVSGIVLDSTGMPLPMVNLKLVSAKDSILTTSDKEGIFIFENVKMATFVLTVSEIGYKISVQRYLNNDHAHKIVLEPVVMRNQSYQLKQVNINGTPSVIYKTDTVEYRASDYKVPAYATVDELLKKMEGMEVGADGSLIHQGQQVTQAKLNGKLFTGGSVTQAIQNLPANIVDKIQIVDDYGDQAARTGIKNGDPTKTLNITTRPDKSIGTMSTITSQEGNDDRYNEQLSAQNIYANRVISLIGNISSTVNGIASSNSTTAPPTLKGGASLATTSTGTSAPGTTQSGSPTISYTNSWNNKISLTGSYAYSFNNTNSISDNYGQTNSSIGSSDFKNNSIIKNDSKNQALKLEFDDNIGKFDYLQISPSFNYNSSSVNSNISTDNLNYFTTGFEHPVVNITTINPTTNYNYGLAALYVHSFKNPKRNFSVQVGFTLFNISVNGNKRADYRYFTDSTQNVLVKDSLSHLLTFKTSNNKVYRSVVTYVEPLNIMSQLEFTEQIRSSVYDNKAISDTVLANGDLKELTELQNIYNFTFTETRLTADYRYNGKKDNLSIGAAVVTTVLSGTQVDNNTNNNVSTSRSDLRLIPVFRYSYFWSSVERFQVSYSGSNTEPNFQQIQPFTDRSDPNNIIIGNPNLKPTFNHNITASYNKYFPNDKFNISFNIGGNLVDNQVSTNIVQVTVPISNTLNQTINEIKYVNLNGDKSVTGAYAISKQLNDRNYNIALNGNIIYGYNNAVSNNLLYHSTMWDFNERFGPRISLNDNIFMINPYVGYDVSKSFNSILDAIPTTIQTFKLAVDGQIYLPKNFQLHYNVSKNYISGFANYNLNPLIINTGFEKRLLRAHNLALTFNVFDLLHQNNFLQQSVTPQSTTYTLSNNNSRYFLFGLKLNLQKWGGTPMHNGQPMKRRGDGSFIN